MNETKSKKCSYCCKLSDNLTHLVFDSFYCSYNCAQAMCDELDGCSIEEAREEWEKREKDPSIISYFEKHINDNEK